jgi:hypothetical protein
MTMRRDADQRPNRPRFFFCWPDVVVDGLGVLGPAPCPPEGPDELGLGLLGGDGSSSNPRLDNSRSNDAVSARSRWAKGWNADS